MKGASIIFWYALIFGIVVALGSYLSALAPKSEWMRSVYIEDIRRDTLPAFVRRLLMGGGAGAVVGILVFIRDRKRQDDDA